MEQKQFLGCALIVIALFSSTVSAVSQCYSCHSSTCNDPFNKSAANVSTCSNSLGRFFPIGNRMKRQASDYACIKYSYRSGNNPVETIRGCNTKQYNDKEACAWITDQLKTQGNTVESCSTCDSDLCNSANSLVNPTHLIVAFVLQTVFLLSLVY